MLLLNWLNVARRVSRPGDARWRVVLGCAVLLERISAPFFVHVVTIAGLVWSVVVGVGLSVLVAARGWVQSAAVARTEASLYVRVVESVLRQDVLRPSVLPDEDAVAAVFSGARTVAVTLAQGFPALCANAVAALVFVVVVAVVAPARVVVCAALAAAAGVALLSVSRRSVDRAQTRESAAWVDMAEGVGRAFEGRLDLVAGGRAGEYASRFAGTVASWRAASARAGRLASLAGRAPLFVLGAVVGGAVVVDGLLRGESRGGLLAEGALLASLSPAFVGLVQGMHDMLRGERRARELLGLLSADPAVTRPSALAQPRGVPRVDVRDLRFSYDGAREVLGGVSFIWRDREVLALAGHNGSGKSTCLRLLLGLSAQASSAIEVDGVPLSQLDVDCWRRDTAFLPQRPYLPPRATVRECLRFVDAEATEAALASAVERVGLDASLGCSAAAALDARVDVLSAGQRQRVALARALGRGARRFVLDEPDANLDHAGVQLVAHLLRELGGVAMVLFAAHSPELLAAADRVVVLDGGVVVPGARSVAAGGAGR